MHRSPTRICLSWIIPCAPFGQQGLANGQLATLIGSAERLPLDDWHHFEQGPVNRPIALCQGDKRPESRGLPAAGSKPGHWQPPNR